MAAGEAWKYVSCPRNFAQILNRYAYVINNPLSFVDANGHCFVICAIIAVVAAVVLARKWELSALISLALAK